MKLYLRKNLWFHVNSHGIRPTSTWHGNCYIFCPHSRTPILRNFVIYCSDHCMKPLETAEQNVRRLANNPSIELNYPECDPTQQQLFSHVKCENCSTR
jgi:hypothetical protein